MLPFGLSAAELPFVAGFVRSIAVATLALLVVVTLQLTTTVRMTPGFAVWFATIATLGVAGIWAFGSWLSAEYLGTVFFATNRELMVFFLTTLVAGLIAAGVFVWYFRRRLRANATRRPTGETI
ncbi:hypothetical protein [Halococcus thailandensis]|uniref:Uncharacterized protein n=1 Tax=Halococcus thailandensis JCM 13552 TaxID=1227457 RepID=M0N5F8_9EURY|nr:hypothetical protein [Halococcus thailandensis]EMA53152.1 hypothetical protein C451_10162 [Halococcus thailandensis JCM 13552]